MGLAARFAGLVALVAAVPACDKAFGLEGRDFETPCGVWGEATPVSIDPRLFNPRRLSFTTPDGVGFVAARLDSMAETTKYYDYPVTWNGSMWAYAPERAGGLSVLATSEFLRHVVSTRSPDTAFGSVSTSEDSAWHAYPMHLSDPPSPFWTYEASTQVGGSTTETEYAGGELLEPTGASVVSSVPVFRTSPDLTHSVALAVKTTSSWVDSQSGGSPTTDKINRKHWATSGAVVRVASRQVLIYSARPRGQKTGADLYFSTRDGPFEEPKPFQAFNTDEEELEPWVDEACTTLTFRRADPEGRSDDDDGDTVTGGTIYQATVLDGAPTDGT